MVTHSQLLALRMEGKLSASEQTILAQIVESGKNMVKLVADVLAYSSVAHENTEMLPVDFNGVLSTVLRNLASLIEHTGVIITRDQLPVIRGQRDQFVQLLQNLVENAIKYRDPSRVPTVHVSAQRAGTWVMTVRDNGIGIPAEYQSRIFGLFKRLDRSQPGTGSGLAICRRIVEHYGGQIWVDSEPGYGAEFIFTLPA